MMKNIQGVVMPKAMTILTLEKAQLASTKPWRWVVCTTLLFTARTTSLMAVFGVTEYVRPMLRVAIHMWWPAPPSTTHIVMALGTGVLDDYTS